MEVSQAFPHSFIAIEGNIGTGKTTFCQMLEKDFGCRLILEEFTDNPFLPLFYDNPERYAFPVELFFMTERYKQLQELLNQGELFRRTTISDYYFFKTLLFAKNNLPDEEFRLFKRLFDVLSTNSKKPDLLVYLWRSVDDLLMNIQNRGREFEKGIKAEYLDQIQKSYLEFFRTGVSFPVLILDIEGKKFWEEKSQYNQMIQLLKNQYPVGLHYESL